MIPKTNVSLVGFVGCCRYHAIMLSLSCYHAINAINLFSDKIYNRLKNDFFFTNVNKKEFFFLRNLFVINNINILLKGRTNTASKNSQGYKPLRKIDCYHRYHAIMLSLSCYHAIASMVRNLKFLGVNYE